MKMFVYSVKDNASGTFLPPFTAYSDTVAKRDFKCQYDDAVRNVPSSSLAMFPGDFDLYLLGTFDNESGKFCLPDGYCDLILSGRSLLPSDDN